VLKYFLLNVYILKLMHVLRHFPSSVFQQLQFCLHITTCKNECTWGICVCPLVSTRQLLKWFWRILVWVLRHWTPLQTTTPVKSSRGNVPRQVLVKNRRFDNRLRPYHKGTHVS
jgi:hypothetical protein